jgi:arylsulfatase A-like enzyme
MLRWRSRDVKRPAGQVVAEPVSTLDLAPTFYECAGVAAPEGLQGRSLRRLLGGEPETRDASIRTKSSEVSPSRRYNGHTERGRA